MREKLGVHVHPELVFTITGIRKPGGAIGPELRKLNGEQMGV